MHISHDVTFQPLIFPLKTKKVIDVTWDFLDYNDTEEVKVPDDASMLDDTNGV